MVTRPDVRMNNPITHALDGITLGEPVTFENITMIPLLRRAAANREPFYLTLDDALARGSTEITEISEQGSVPELRLINKGAQPVFILGRQANGAERAAKSEGSGVSLAECRGPRHSKRSSSAPNRTASSI